MENPFIVLEGVDGTGKSTIVPMLAESIGAMGLSTPLEPHKSNRPRFDSENFNPQNLFEFYLDSVNFASEQIAIVRKVMPVVCDRWIASTYAYHIGMGLDSSIADEMISHSKIHEPTIAFQLECDDSVLAERLRLRGSRALRADWIANIRSIYSKFNFDVVDTTHLTMNEVVDEIKRRLILKKIITVEA